MTVFQAMEMRVSRRAYADIPVGHALAKRLTEDIAHLNRVAGLSIRFVPDGSGAFAKMTRSYGLFSNVTGVFSMAGKENDPFLAEKIGYFGQFLVLQATRLGLATCWVGGSFDKDYPLCTLAASEKQLCIVTVGHPLPEQTAKEKLIRGVLRRADRPMEALYETDQTPPDWFIRGMRAVSKAPSARNMHKTRFHWKNGKVFVESETRYAYQKIDKGIAKAHFALGAGGRFNPGENSAFIKENNQLAAWPFAPE